MSPTVVGRAVKETPKVIKTNLKKKRTFINPATHPQSCLGFPINLIVSEILFIALEPLQMQTPVQIVIKAAIDLHNFY